MAKSGGLDELGDKTIFTDNIGLYLTTATYLARKKSISAKKRKIRAMTPIKVIQGHRDHCNRKPVCDFLLATGILSRTVSVLSQLIVQILDTACVFVFPLGGLGTKNDVHLLFLLIGLTGKRVYELPISVN